MKQRIEALIEELKSSEDAEDLAVAGLLSAVLGSMWEGRGASLRMLEYLLPFQRAAVARVRAECASIIGGLN